MEAAKSTTSGQIQSVTISPEIAKRIEEITNSALKLVLSHPAHGLGASGEFHRWQGGILENIIIFYEKASDKVGMQITFNEDKVFDVILEENRITKLLTYTSSKPHWIEEIFNEAVELEKRQSERNSILSLSRTSETPEAP